MLFWLVLVNIIAALLNKSSLLFAQRLDLLSRMLKIIKGFVFLSLLTIACFNALILLIPPFLLLSVHSKRVIRWRRAWADVVSGIFLDFASALHIKFCGTKIFIYSTSKEVLTDKGALIICNHRCRVDWMYAGWCYAHLTGQSPQLRVVLKESLRSVPLFGWAMQILIYIFLDRRRDMDLQHIERSLGYLLYSGERPTVFLFPEGTDLSPSNVIKNTEYAQKNGLPEWKYVLLPKPSGLQSCLSTLWGHEAPVHDTTIAYKDFRSGQRPTENALLRGEFPKEIHLCVKRYAPDSIHTDRPMLERWLKGSFAKKERLLKSFYENGSCVLTTDPFAPQPSSSSPQKAKQNDELWPPLLATTVDTWRPLYVMVLLVALNSFMLIYFSWMRYIVTIMVLACVASRLVGGIDKMELALHGDMLIAEGKKLQKGKED